MTERHLPVGVVAALRRQSGLGESSHFAATVVLPGAPDVAPGTTLGPDTIYAGSATVALFASETGHYRDNLVSGAPKLWAAIVTRNGHAEVLAVTADPYEGEALATAPEVWLEALPMPPSIEAEVAAFVAAHHVERTFFKRTRDKAGRGGPEEGAR